MFFPMFLGAAVVTLLFAALAIKFKKVRGLFAVLMIVALLPTAVLGLITFGQGDLINYPGNPSAAVLSMTDAVRIQDFDAADDRVLGTLGMTAADIDADTDLLQQLMGSCLTADGFGEAVYEEFTCTLPVELTRLDTDAWLRALAEETATVLQEFVQDNPRKDVFTQDGTAYLDGVTDAAYRTAYERMLTKGMDYLRTDTVNVTMCWTPFGWQIIADEALLSALEGFPVHIPEEEGREGILSAQLDALLYSTYVDIMGNLPLFEKVYTIPVTDLVAPKPNPDGFGSTADPNEVLAVIERAKNLIGDRTLSWSPEIEIKPGSVINYYYDESILVIQWKEFRDWSLATFAEIIVKDGSQIRRVISGNEYRRFDWETPTQMSQRTNAVLGMTGDFYMFRACGIMVYQGQVYRDTPESLHHLFFTNSGEMLLTKSYEVAGEDAAAYVAEHDVNFSLAFGPVIIENGEKLPMPNYLVGEFYDDYPRAAIGEVDPLHFIVMTVGEEGPRENQTVTLPEAQQYIWEKGVHKAYSLDGGKTANMTFNGELTNDPRYREERTMSDMFYFASAIPEDER